MKVVAKTVRDYAQRWQEAIEHDTVIEIGRDADLTPQSTLFFQSARSTPMGEGIWSMPDFGDAICFFRYSEIPDDLNALGSEPADDAAEEIAAMLPGFKMMQDSWAQRQPKWTHEQVAARKAKADEALDALLEDFVRVGYQPNMPDRLRTIANAALTDWEVEEIWNLPGDLPELLKFTGNPLTDHFPYDDEADEQAAEARAPVFDLNNAVHRAALKERIWEMFL